MADPTYQVKVYHRQGGDVVVVANGGKIEVESGGEIEQQSGAKETIQSGSEIEIQSGATLDLQAGSNNIFGATTIDGSELEQHFLSLRTFTGHASADISAGSRLSPGYGIHFFSAATGMSKASAVMPLAVKGATLTLDFNGFVTDANISIIASASTVITPITGGSVLSNLNVSAAGYIKLIATSESAWQVVEDSGSITGQAA